MSWDTYVHYYPTYFHYDGDLNGVALRLSGENHHDGVHQATLINLLIQLCIAHRRINWLEEAYEVHRAYIRRLERFLYDETIPRLNELRDIHGLDNVPDLDPPQNYRYDYQELSELQASPCWDGLPANWDGFGWPQGPDNYPMPFRA
jgi:hypothetical protein